MRFSIIIPVYNVEEYIEECVQSVLSQTYKDYEIILVDDGSTDNSGKILDRYVGIENVFVHHKENGGLSDARNYGLKRARGDYLLFVDSDDFFNGSKCLDKISRIIDSFQPDVIQYKKIYWYSEKNIKFDKQLKEGMYYDVLNLISILNKESLVSVSSCDKAIKRDIVLNNKLEYIKGLLSEDIMFSYQLFLNIKNIYLLNENIYAYRQIRRGSITATKSKKSFNSMYYIIMHWITFTNNNEEYKKLYLNLISYWYLILRTDYPTEYYSSIQKQKFKELDIVLLKYNENFKVKMAYKLSKKIGYNNMISILRLYQKLKKKGFIRL